ncbi:hypothetical protein MXL46_08360 [Heyndrickxia sporothermodurans]|uniref:hypothetical protein n=1 Tax=Heyndrickxia sporothermodurans TaxID=46224 RepID=UPI002DBA12B8|nr:hypothetical protein [Heyndrickxia sporothermodurans]MEB6549108.1 hypothetical protein [Heyndrickxia sporothermodurans]
MKLERFKFGDIIENGWASKDNPSSKSIFIRHKKKTIEVTDGKGKFWEIYHDSENRNTCIGSIFENPELLEVES